MDRKEGVYRELSEKIDIIDLPGIYSLSPYTPKEVVSRNYIMEESPDLVINIVDATNLERNLYLTTQLLESDIPVVVALNMMDVLEKEGSEIDAERLSEQLGVPVVAISALRSEGIRKLMEKAVETARVPRAGSSPIERSTLAPAFARIVALMREKKTRTLPGRRRPKGRTDALS